MDLLRRRHQCTGKINPFSTPKMILVYLQVFCPRVGSAVLKGLIKDACYHKGIKVYHILAEICCC